MDRFVRERPDSHRWLVEVHPEVSFRALGGPLLAKKTVAGHMDRLAALRAKFPDIDAAIAAAALPRKVAGRDDVLDAYAGLWSALRFRTGSHETLGGEPDAHGIPMRMIV